MDCLRFMDEYRIRVYARQGFTRELQGTRLILTRLQLPEFELESFVYFLISNEHWLRSVTISNLYIDFYRITLPTIICPNSMYICIHSIYLYRVSHLNQLLGYLPNIDNTKRCSKQKFNGTIFPSFTYI